MSEPTRSQIKKAITEGINELRLEMKEYFSNIDERLTKMEEELSKDITSKYGPVKSKLNTDYSISEQMQDDLEPIPNRQRLSKREEVLLDPLAASQRSDKKKKYIDDGPKYEGPWGKDLGLK